MITCTVTNAALMAYFDPSLGSFLIQLVVASTLGIGIFLRRHLLGAAVWFKSHRRT